MGFGGEGSLVLNHSKRPLLSNRELQKLINEAKERRIRSNSSIKSSRTKHVRFSTPPTYQREEESRENESVSEIVKAMDIHCSGYVTPLVRHWLRDTGFEGREQISLKELEDALRYTGRNTSVYRGLLLTDPKYQYVDLKTFGNIITNSKWQ